jgi:hypothetical protein
MSDRIWLLDAATRFLRVGRAPKGQRANKKFRFRDLMGAAPGCLSRCPPIACYSRPLMRLMLRLANEKAGAARSSQQQSCNKQKRSEPIPPKLGPFLLPPGLKTFPGAPHDPAPSGFDVLSPRPSEMPPTYFMTAPARPPICGGSPRTCTQNLRSHCLADDEKTNSRCELIPPSCLVLLDSWQANFSPAAHTASKYVVNASIDFATCHAIWRLIRGLSATAKSAAPRHGCRERPRRPGARPPRLPSAC